MADLSKLWMNETITCSCDIDTYYESIIIIIVVIIFNLLVMILTVGLLAKKIFDVEKRIRY